MQRVVRDESKVASDQATVLSIGAAQALFRQQFKRSLKSCMKHNFSIEECFGTIWQETMEKVSIAENQQRALYEELLDWAKRRMK